MAVRHRTEHFGIAASPGYAVGQVYLIDKSRPHVPQITLSPQQVGEERARLEAAIFASETQLRQIRDDLQGDQSEQQMILDVHLLMLRDDLLIGGVHRLIEQQLINAEQALVIALRGLRQMFDGIEDEYFRERRSDLDFVGDRLLRNLLGDAQPALPPLSPDAVVVAADLSPADVAVLSKGRIQAFLTDAGGRTSHTAIMARQARLPAVVALEDLSLQVNHGDPILVDAVAGHVIVRPSAEECRHYRELSQHYQSRHAQMEASRLQPAVTRDGQPICLRANIEAPEETHTAMESGAAGVGLFRTEYLFMRHGDQLPDEETQYRAYRSVLEAVGDEGATIRTLDIGGDKLIESMSHHPEFNPVLGLRGVRFCLQERPLFRTQLRALLRAARHGELRIMIPLIGGLDEVDACRQLIDEVHAELCAEGTHLEEPPALGIMIELPSAAQTADLLASCVDFFSIGTNDLIQYTLAIDRANEQVAHLYQPLHPAVLRQLRFVARAAQAEGIGLSLCGEMGGDPRYVPVLLGLGLTELSASASAIPVLKAVLRSLDTSDCRQLIAQLWACTRPEQAERCLDQWLSATLPASLLPEMRIAAGARPPATHS